MPRFIGRVFVVIEAETETDAALKVAQHFNRLWPGGRSRWHWVDGEEDRPNMFELLDLSKEAIDLDDNEPFDPHHAAAVAAWLINPKK